jgi:hypothetical protein
MKAIMRWAAAGALAAGGVQIGLGQALFDNFNTYADGDITTSSGGAWAVQSTGSPTIQISSGAAVINQAVFSPASNERVARSLGATFSTSGGNPSTVYAAFDANWSQLPLSTTGAYFLNFGTGTSSTATFYGRVGATVNGAATGSFRVAVANANWSSANEVTYPQDLSFNVTYEIVVKYDLNTRDTTLWINPTSAGSTSVTATDAGVGVQGDITAVSLRQGVTNTGHGAPGELTLDNLAVGGTFISVVPEPGAYAAAFGAGLTVFGLWRRRR